MAKVVLERVSKTYAGGVPAVREVCLSVADGEFVVLVGPSGCGKSTTLRLVAGLEEIDSGTLTIDGRPMNDVPPKDRDVAMVFQNYALYPHMTVYRNMAFGLRLRGFPRDEIERRVREASALLGLDDLLHRRPREISGGQRQRVAVGRAIVRHPKVFLFDEPLSNLDAKLRVQMRAELRALHARLRATMIYVTHDQVEAMTMGDRVVVMHEGLVQQAAPPGELYDRPANVFVAGFIGSPPMNFLPGRAEAGPGGLRVRADGLALALPAPAGAGPAGRAVTLGVRPEHLAAAAAGPDAFPAAVEAVEPTGAETLVHVRAGPHRLVVRRPGHERPAVGTALDLAVAPGGARFFDSKSGASIP